MAKKDYYGIMGIPCDAASGEIRKAFQKLALEWHPDRNKSPDAEEKFKEINEAYHVLSDPAKRTQYDKITQTGTVPPEEVLRYYDTWARYSQTMYEESYRIANEFEKLAERNARIMNTVHFWGGWFLNMLAVAALFVQFLITGFTPAKVLVTLIAAGLGIFLVVVTSRRSCTFAHKKRKRVHSAPDKYIIKIILRRN